MINPLQLVFPMASKSSFPILSKLYHLPRSKPFSLERDRFPRMVLWTVMVRLTERMFTFFFVQKTIKTPGSLKLTYEG